MHSELRMDNLVKKTNTKIFVIIAFALLFIIAGCDVSRDNPNDPKGKQNIIAPDEDHETIFLSTEIRTKHFPYEDVNQEEDRIIAITEARITDPDEIESVHLEMADTLRFLMNHNSSSNYYSYEFNPFDHDYGIFDFVGSPHYIYVYDSKGFVQRSEKLIIIRILEDTPEIFAPKTTSGSPIPTDSVEATPTLVWHEYQSRFPITYTVSVKINGESDNVFERSGIQRVSAQNDTLDSLQVTQPLVPGIFYLWTVAVVDKYGNETVSKKEYFIVKRGE